MSLPTLAPARKALSALGEAEPGRFTHAVRLEGVGQAILMNPASSVRVPRHSVKKGKTPVLTAEEARALLDAIDEAGKAMRREMCGWGLSRLSRYDLGELLTRFRPVLVGWVRYYGLFHPSSLQRALKSLDHHLVTWARAKYKKLRGRCMRAWDWLRGLRQRAPTLFPHWSAAIMMTGR